MRLTFWSSIITLLVLFAYPAGASENEVNLLATYEGDVTGLGDLQTIELYGILFDPDSAYYRDIYAIIRSDSDEWRIDYQGGYDPEIQLIDLNHDGVLDIFYQSPTGGSGGLYTSLLDTVAGGELTEIPLPEQSYVQGYFEDGFQAIIEIAPNTKPIVMNVEERKKDYIRLGIFDEKGKLLEKTPLIIDPIAFFEPVQISERNGYGLKSYKQISGAYHADQLGVLETLWYYENGRWVILQTEWKESGEYDAGLFY